MPRTRVHVDFGNIGGIVNSKDETDIAETQLADAKNVEGDMLGAIGSRRTAIAMSVTPAPADVVAGGGSYNSVDGIELNGIVRLDV